MTFGAIRDGQINNPNGRNGSLDEKECRRCGETFKILANHIQNCPEVDR